MTNSKIERVLKILFLFFDNTNFGFVNEKLI